MDANFGMFPRDVSLGSTDVSIFDQDWGCGTWTYDSLLLLYTVRDADKFYAEAEGYLKSIIPDAEMCQDVFNFQKARMNLMHRTSADVHFSHNWYDYFEGILSGNRVELKNEPTDYHFEYCGIDDMGRYAKEIIWYGSRNKLLMAKPEKILGGMH